ncbi:hypothetical protein BH10ACT11_BH10ACT11_04490 [soil metagenome]
MRIRFVTVTVAAVLVVGLGVGTASAGGGPQYQGSVEKDPNTFLGFDVTGSGKHRKVKNFSAGRIAVACDSQSSDGRAGELKFVRALKVNKKGKFGGTASAKPVFRQALIPNFKMTVHGKLGRKGKATGTLELNSTGVRCYTGALNWKAKKPK